jgi:hypothetical protein
MNQDEVNKLIDQTVEEVKKKQNIDFTIGSTATDDTMKLAEATGLEPGEIVRRGLTMYQAYSELQEGEEIYVGNENANKWYKLQFNWNEEGS